MDVDLGKCWCLFTIRGQTSNVVMHNALNTDSLYSTPGISKLFADICSEGTERKA